jgi:hypothetical protein
MIKLDLKQNAFHTLRHAIEHLACASKDDELPSGKKWDHDDDGVVWERDGRKFFEPAGPLARRPAPYNLKFALLHLIQSCELLLKAHLVETCGASSILDGKNGQRTITIHKALSLTSASVNGLLTSHEFELLCRANDLRNQMQHHSWAYAENVLRRICMEFLVICCFLSQKLFGVNVVSELMYDPWTEGPDALGDYLSTIGYNLSLDSRPTTDKIAADWLARNPRERALLCINCGSRTFAPATGFCAACGAEGDERSSALVEELEDLTKKICEIRRSSELRTD